MCVCVRERESEEEKERERERESERETTSQSRTAETVEGRRVVGMSLTISGNLPVESSELRLKILTLPPSTKCTCAPVHHATYICCSFTHKYVAA